MKLKLIDKAAVVAEIERRKRKLLDHIICERDKEWVVRTAHQLNRIIMFLDTLEVKEVDLQSEIDRVWNNTSDNFSEDGWKEFKEIAKHFFEFGLSVNNPITAADRGMVEEIIINLKRVENDYRIDLTREIEWLRNKGKKGGEV